MARIVMKFGGTSVANLERIRNVAQHIKREINAGHEVAVVVSAMAGHTNQLVQWTQEATIKEIPMEYDAVVASGEQVTAGLLSLCLNDISIKARSWMGWQIPIYTDSIHGAARIQKINKENLLESLSAHRSVSHFAAVRLEPMQFYHDRQTVNTLLVCVALDPSLLM